MCNPDHNQQLFRAYEKRLQNAIPFYEWKRKFENTNEEKDHFRWDFVQKVIPKLRFSIQLNVNVYFCSFLSRSQSLTHFFQNLL